MAEEEPNRPKAFVEKLTEGPLDRPAVLKEICMDLLMLQVQTAGILQHLSHAVALPDNSRKEIDRLQELMGDRVDSMLDALTRLEGRNG